LQAHNYNYQRTYPLSYDSADSSEPTIPNYNGQYGGIVFAIVGTGGEGFYPLESQAAFTATQFTRFGFLNIEISNGNPPHHLNRNFL
jgi:hypothetical protein